MRALSLALAVLVMAASAAAEPAGRVAELTPAQRKPLDVQIAAARQQTPEAFARLAAVRGYLPEVYLKTRLRKPLLGPELRALGPAGLLPMLAALAETGLPGAPDRLTTAQRTAIELGLLTAVSELRDPRALPVLRAAFQQGQAHVVQAAALGLGALCSSEALAVLDGGLAGGSDRRVAALAGLGQCRRKAALERLGKRMLAGLPPAELAIAVTALGQLAGSWALAAEVAGGRLTPAQAAALRDTALLALAGIASKDARVTFTVRQSVALISDKLP